MGHVEFSHFEYDEDCQDSFEYLVEDLQDALHEVFPSVYACDRWIDREVRAFAHNNFATFNIAEYCGIVSISVTPKDVDYTQEGIRDAWITRVGKNFSKVIRSSVNTPLVKQGTFSNGEAVFSAV